MSCENNLTRNVNTLDSVFANGKIVVEVFRLNYIYTLVGPIEFKRTRSDYMKFDVNQGRHLG